MNKFRVFKVMGIVVDSLKRNAINIQQSGFILAEDKYDCDTIEIRYKGYIPDNMLIDIPKLNGYESDYTFRKENNIKILIIYYFPILKEIKED